MTHPEYLAARDINSRAEKLDSVTIPVSTGNPVLDANIYDLAQRFSGSHSSETVLQLLATVMNAAQSPIPEHELQIMNRTVDELYAANKLFLPYKNVRKITCFGSARIKPEEEAYKIAHDFAQISAKNGYMIITGGGPGIMQACNEGATEHFSFGLNITLPFEQHPNPVMAGSDKMMNFYYFFTRKLNLVKETDALVAFPGGFGTMDEIYETITLMQTGKAAVFPVVLLDPPGDFFWKRWVSFIKKELLEEGLISNDDMDLIYITQDAEDAYRHIDHFYSTFHSYYFTDELITIRLMQPIAEAKLTALGAKFADLMPKDDLRQITKKDEEDHEGLLRELPRLRFTFKRGNYARLRLLIDAINS